MCTLHLKSPSSHIFLGHITLSTLDPVSIFKNEIVQFILTCISTDGPATTVTWTTDSTTTVTEGTKTVLNDRVIAQYTHTLTVTAAGVYTCTVANSVSSHSADITLQGIILSSPSLYSVIYCVQEPHLPVK